jgi:hypothetical protein
METKKKGNTMNTNVPMKQQTKPGQLAELGESRSQRERPYPGSFGMEAPLALRAVSSPCLFSAVYRWRIAFPKPPITCISPANHLW